MKINVYEVKETLQNTGKSVFFSDKKEAYEFGKKIEDAIEEYGFKIYIEAKKMETSDDKIVHVVSGHVLLFWNDSSDDKKQEISKFFASKEEAEKEVKSFYEDLKDASSIFKISAKIVI